MRSRKTWATILLTACVMVPQAMAAVPDLHAIPTLGVHTGNTALAMTPDGRYIVGQSGAAQGYLWEYGSAAPVNVLSSDNAQALTANGVGYRTSSGQTEVIVRGIATSAHVAEWMTTDGTSFGIKRRDTAYTRNVTSSYNQLGSMLGSDAYFTVSRTASGGDTSPDISRGYGPWVATIERGVKGTTESARMNAVSATGRAVGRRLASSVPQNYSMVWAGATTPAAAYFSGLDGSLRGEAFGVSLDGMVAIGGSPLVAGDANNVLYGYKAVFAAANSNTLASINQLPLLGDPSTYTSTTKNPAYGVTADGDWIVGYDYHTVGGVGKYHAVLWDTRDAKSANWQAIDLTQYASDHGILDGFTMLNRAYSVGVNADGNIVVSGEGTYTGGFTRAYAMTYVVPEPATMALLALGALPLLRRRRR